MDMEIGEEFRTESRGYTTAADKYVEVCVK